MTEQAKKEIIKSFAYGMCTEEVSESYGISFADAIRFAEEHSAEITDKKSQLEKEDWM